ncbi:MAG: hypothetical protein VX938_07375, partial [Myxococcota bacterium]|nr:hypothetical protein [Myxococcota bacterium]
MSLALVAGLWFAFASPAAIANPDPAPAAEAAAVVDPSVARLASPPGREGMARRLISGVGFMKEGEGGLLFSSIALTEREVTYEIRRAADLPDGPVLATLILAPRGLSRPGEETSQTFVLRSTNPTGDEAVASLIRSAMDSVIANDKGSFYVEREDVVVEDLEELSVELPREVTETLGTRWEMFREWRISGMVQALTHLAYGGVALLIWGMILVALIPFRERDYSFSRKLKANHLLPVGVQILLFAYW